ncbi:MAG: MepB family protein [Sphingobacteriaceae bacterium]
MIEELSRIENSILKTIGLDITSFEKDKECEEYHGYNLQLGRENIKFRKAKVTPKKIGQFVTLWKRSSDGQTIPFDLKDNFEFYIFAAAESEQFGFFIFPKKILADKQILSAGNREGKRGFRIYPDWDCPQNKQAEKTKRWQTEYFIDLTENRSENIEKFRSIFKLY